jgi:hypothetical protein
MSGGWRPAWPELVIAAILVLVLSTAGLAFAGPAAAVVILIVSASAGIAALRALVPPARPPAAPPPSGRQNPTAGPARSFSGFWRRRAELAEATASMSGYEMKVRPVLQHLLAARLAEHHGISLAQDPAAGRRLLCPGPRDDALWSWVDPDGPVQDGARPGIPPRTLAALIDRLERL